MCREHDRRALRDIAYRFDENNALFLKPIYNGFVMNNLVKAIDGGGEGANHPRECLDRHLYTGAETTWSRKQHRVHLVALDIVDRLLHHDQILLMSLYF